MLIVPARKYHYLGIGEMFPSCDSRITIDFDSNAKGLDQAYMLKAPIT